MKLLKNITLLALIMGFFMSNDLMFAAHDEMGEPTDWNEPTKTVEEARREELKEEEAKKEAARLEAERQNNGDEKPAPKKGYFDGAKKAIKNAIDSAKNFSFKAKPKAEYVPPVDDKEPGTKPTAETEQVSGGDFDIVNHEDAGTISPARRAEIAKMTPQEIADAEISDDNTNPANWSSDELKWLSPEQTKALTTTQLVSLQLNGRIANLSIPALDPEQLANIFKFSNRGEPWSDAMVKQLTADQITEILKDPNNNIHSYLNGKQLSTMREVLNPSKSLGTKAKEAVASAVSAIKSSRFGRWISDQVDSINRQVNEAGARRTAGSLARDPNAKLFLDQKDAQEATLFQKSVDKLPTKEKENVANQWLDSRERIHKAQQTALTKQITTLQAEVRATDSNEDASQADQALARAKDAKIQELSDQLHTNIDQFAKERTAFKNDMQATLKPNEMIIELQDTINPENHAFEILDMNKIDPTKSIDAQFRTMEQNMQISTHTSSDGKSAIQISKADLLNDYSTWVAKKITFDPSSNKSISEQVNDQMKQWTGKTIEACDPSIQKAIIDRLSEDVREQYTNAKNAERIDILNKLQQMEVAPRKAGRNIAAPSLSPEAISIMSLEVLADLDPETIAKFKPDQIKALTKEQVNALKPEQLQKLSKAQLEVLNISTLASAKLELILSDLSPTKISSLTLSQVDGLNFNTVSPNLLLQADQIAALAPKITDSNIVNELLNTLTDTKLDAFTSHLSGKQLQTITPKQLETIISKLSDSQIRTLTTRQIDNINFTNIKIETFSAKQLQALAPKITDSNIATELLDTLTGDNKDAFFTQLSPKVLPKLSEATQVSIIEDLTPKQISSISTKQIEALSPEVVKAALAPKQISRLSEVQVEALTLDQLQSMSKPQRLALNKEDLENALLTHFAAKDPRQQEIEKILEEKKEAKKSPKAKTAEGQPKAKAKK